jgi:hypothetical protein
MAIFHLSVKTFSRSAGRTATGAAAYRAGEKIVDERSKDIFDYSRKSGVESADIFLPPGAPIWATDRSKLWNAAEQTETRINSTVAREFEVAIPSELSNGQGRELVHEFARELVKKHGFALDAAIHAPGKEGDNRNRHAHILTTTRRLNSDGFGKKCRELDSKANGEIDYWRERWAQLTNTHLEKAGISARIDHRTLKAQGITDREPTVHIGPSATGFERRTGEKSDIRIRQEITDRLKALSDLGELERIESSVNKSIIDLSGDLNSAIRERDNQSKEAARALSVQQAAAARIAAEQKQYQDTVDRRQAERFTSGGLTANGQKRQVQPAQPRQLAQIDANDDLRIKSMKKPGAAAHGPNDDLRVISMKKPGAAAHGPNDDLRVISMKKPGAETHKPDDDLRVISIKDRDNGPPRQRM